MLHFTHMEETREDKDKRYAELVGEKLRRMRQDRSLSLQEVCERSGGSFVVSTLSAYERGKRSLSLERLCELADREVHRTRTHFDLPV